MTTMSAQPWLLGSGLTRYGRHDGRSTLDLMSEAAAAALADAGLERGDIDGLVCGYSTTMPHIMLATVFAEHFGVRPTYAHAIQMGGATGFGLVMLAHLLIRAGANVSAANRAGAKPMQLAALNGSAAMVERLIRAGADPDVPLTPSGDTALMMASRIASECSRPRCRIER